MNRRTVLACFTAALACRPAFAAREWRMSVGELRCGGGLANRACASTLATALGVTVRPIPLEGAALIEAFHAGQIEFGRFDGSLAGPIRALMGDRVISPLPGVFLLRSLPFALRADLVAALSQV